MEKRWIRCGSEHKQDKENDQSEGGHIIGLRRRKGVIHAQQTVKRLTETQRKGKFEQRRML